MRRLMLACQAWLPWPLIVGVTAAIAYQEAQTTMTSHGTTHATIALAYSFLAATVCLLLTARPVFSATFALILVLSIIELSRTKFFYTQMKLLPQDLYYHLGQWAEWEFFLSVYRSLVVKMFLATAAAIALLLVAWRSDAFRIRRAISLVLLVIAGIASEALAREAPIQNLYALAAFNERHLSEFILSTRDLVRLRQEPLALPTGDNTVPTPAPTVAEIASRERIKPNIIVVLHESSVDPSIYFDGKRYEVPKSFFQSGDGQIRRLLVHIYGGGTWVSEHGFLLGVDVSYFGERQNFIGVLGLDRFQNSIPQELKRLGYLTVANYPSPGTFMNTKRFYRSIGFDVVNEPNEMGLHILPLKPGRPRDRAYYEFMLKDFAQRRAAKHQEPIFYFVWTTATHGPYVTAEFPTERSDEIVKQDEPAEFARRQRFAADDLAWIENELRKRFPNEAFLIAGFGDHHPYVTGPYFKGAKSAPLRAHDPNEGSLKTYYRINGINFLPSYSNLPATAEIGFLGEIILEAAGLDASPALMARRTLRMRCDGLWATCSKTDAVLGANSQLSTGTTSIFKN
jgi:Sulfatase